MGMKSSQRPPVENWGMWIVESIGDIMSFLSVILDRIRQFAMVFQPKNLHNSMKLGNNDKTFTWHTAIHRESMFLSSTGQ